MMEKYWRWAAQNRADATVINAIIAGICGTLFIILGILALSAIM